jgi:hypothetical protein
MKQLFGLVLLVFLAGCSKQTPQRFQVYNTEFHVSDGKNTDLMKMAIKLDSETGRTWALSVTTNGAAWIEFSERKSN